MNPVKLGKSVNNQRETYFLKFTLPSLTERFCSKLSFYRIKTKRQQQKVTTFKLKKTQ